MRNPRRPAQLLLEWYASARRDLPWRRTRDPWRVLVSEVMLQQTRVSAVIPYYERFLARFPSPQALAGAEEEELLALWAGLGYYSRARNLKRAAEAICARGGFPETAEEWRALPGIGEYTAAAVASICFREPVAVLDGNVARVMARLTAEEGDIASGSVRLRLKEQAQALLDPAHPGDFNQALMELGATVCLPRQPKCLLCPWQDVCLARRRGRESELPVKARRRQPEKVALRLALIVDRGRLLLRRRPEDGRRLAGFWELPSVEELGPARSLKLLGRFRHSITHHNYEVEVWHGRLRRAPADCQWQDLKTADALPLGAMVRKALALLAAPEPQAGDPAHAFAHAPPATAEGRRERRRARAASTYGCAR